MKPTLYYKEVEKDTYIVHFSDYKGEDLCSTFQIEIDEDSTIENKRYCCPLMDIYGEESLESCIKALRVNLGLTTDYKIIKGNQMNKTQIALKMTIASNGCLGLSFVVNEETFFIKESHFRGLIIYSIPSLDLGRTNSIEELASLLSIELQLGSNWELVKEV